MKSVFLIGSFVGVYLRKEMNCLPGGWWQSKSALNRSRDILFLKMASTMFMS